MTSIPSRETGISSRPTAITTMSEFALETLYHAPRRNPQALSLRRRAHCSDAISTTPHVELNGGYAIPV